MTEEYRCKCGSLKFDYLCVQFLVSPTFLGQEVPVLDLVNCKKCNTTKVVGGEYIERAGINQIEAFEEYLKRKK